MSAPLQMEEYEIYRDVLLQKFNKPRRERFVIQKDLRAFGVLNLRRDETVRSKILHWRLKLKGLEAATADDFVKQIAGPACLEPKFELPLPYALLSESESTELWNRSDKESLRGRTFDGWKVFRERYPGAGGVIRFSRVGFDEHKTQALVNVGFQADWLMGHGGLVFLSQDERGWKVRSELHLWIS